MTLIQETVLFSLGIGIGLGLLLGFTLSYCFFKILHPSDSFRDFLRSFKG